ncbi:MAG: hypothetical protein OCU12_07765 [Methanophagales archaeon]|nr:hypothetical protein [Methanophagales archaeon]
MMFADLGVGMVFRLPVEGELLRPYVKLSDVQAGALLTCHRFFFNPGERVERCGLDAEEIVILGKEYGLDDRTALFVLGYVLQLLNVRDRAAACANQDKYFSVEAENV